MVSVSVLFLFLLLFFLFLLLFLLICLFVRTIHGRISANHFGADKQVITRLACRLSAVGRDATLIAGFFVVVVVVMVLHFTFHFRRSAKDIRLGAGLHPMTHRSTPIAISLFGFAASRATRIQSGQRRVRCVGQNAAESVHVICYQQRQFQ